MTAGDVMEDGGDQCADSAADSQQPQAQHVELDALYSGAHQPASEGIEHPLAAHRCSQAYSTSASTPIRRPWSHAS